MKVLITGGAGFIGSNFIHYLAQHRPDWKLYCLDLLTYAGNLDNIASLIEEGKVSFSRGDIADAALVKALFEKEKFDLVFNFAAESHVDRSISSASEFVKTNVLGTQTLLDSAKHVGVQRYVQISTDEVYGSLGPTGQFVEDTPLDPTSPYAASKAAADLLVAAFNKTHGLDTVVTRCSNNYGPYQFPEKLMPLFITNAMENKDLPLYGDGLNVRSWLHVTDHCSALLIAAESARSGEVYNIGGSAEWELSNLDVTKKILAHLNKPESLIKPVSDRLAHDRRYAIDFSKINNELSWSPATPFEQGLKDTIDWYVSNQAWWSKIKSGEYMQYYEQHYANRL